MKRLEFSEAVVALREKGVIVEDWLDIDSARVARWQQGEDRIPRVRARQIEWLLKQQENESRLAAANLPQCSWSNERTAELERRASEPNGLTPEYLEAFNSERSAHVKECDVCTSNEEWAKRNLIELGHYPQPGIAASVLGVIGKVPKPLVPAAIGAGLLGGIVTLRVVGSVGILLVLSRDLGAVIAGLGAAVLAIAAATVAGAAGGLVIPIARPILRKLGTAGDYLTGILVVEAYAWALVLLAPIAFGEGLLKNPGDWKFFAGYAAFLGLFGAYFYRRYNPGGTTKV
jgi:hypothetical protein